MIHVNDMPGEVLEFILSHLHPYNDLDQCALVCKLWSQIVYSNISIYYSLMLSN